MNWHPHDLNLTLAVLMLCGCAEVRPHWNGFYVGTQVVTPYNVKPTKDNASVYGTAIIGLGERNSLQLQVSEPVTAWDTPVLRLAVDRKIF